ncbi:MAG: hypothetical protein V8R51_03595 [Clostridia bacterium]
MVDTNEMLIQILQTLNNFQVQTAASFNELRAEIKKSREIENEHWQENLRRWEENKKKWEENEKRWEENDKRWEQNEKRWEENDKRWKENEKRWIQYEINRKNDHQEIMDIFVKYDIAISKKIGDPNVDKMKKVLKI